MPMPLDQSTNRAIITVLGSDRSDISQTILQGIFTMTMLVDLESAKVEFSVLQAQLDELSHTLDVQITMQREEVFRYMYRL